MRAFILTSFISDTATTEIYTLSLHDALPICASTPRASSTSGTDAALGWAISRAAVSPGSVSTRSAIRPSFGGSSSSIRRSEEHKSELQSRQYLVCRLLLEKKQTQAKCLRAQK